MIDLFSVLPVLNVNPADPLDTVYEWPQTSKEKPIVIDGQRHDKEDIVVPMTFDELVEIIQSDLTYFLYYIDDEGLGVDYNTPLYKWLKIEGIEFITLSYCVEVNKDIDYDNYILLHVKNQTKEQQEFLKMICGTFTKNDIIEHIYRIQNAIIL